MYLHRRDPYSATSVRREATADDALAAWIGIENVRLVFSERVVLGPLPSLFRKLGVEPFEAMIVGFQTGFRFTVMHSRHPATIRANGRVGRAAEPAQLR